MSGMKGPDIFKEIEGVSSVEDAQRIVKYIEDDKVDVNLVSFNSKKDKVTLLQHIIMQPEKHRFLGMVVEAMLKIPSMDVNKIEKSRNNKKKPFFMAIFKYKLLLDNRFYDKRDLIHTLHIIKCLLNDHRTDINNCNDDEEAVYLSVDSASHKTYCNTPLMYAIHFFLFDIAYLLMDNVKIDLNKVLSADGDELVALNFAFRLINLSRDKKFDRYAQGAQDFLQRFIEHNKVDLQKALDLAVWHLNSRKKFIMYLIENVPVNKSLDINKLYFSTKEPSFTLLQRATFHGYEELIEFLLQRPDINVNIENNNKMTALNIAILSDKIDIVKLFLAKEDLNTSTETISSLILAVKVDNPEIVIELLKLESVKSRLGLELNSALPEQAYVILNHFNPITIIDSTGQLIPVDVTIPENYTALSIDRKSVV